MKGSEIDESDPDQVRKVVVIEIDLKLEKEEANRALDEQIIDHKGNNLETSTGKTRGAGSIYSSW